MKRNKKKFLYFVILIFLSGCSRPSLIKEARILMDTFSEISCVSSDKDIAQKGISEAFEEMERIERIFNKFDKNSELSRINALAGKEEVKIDTEFFGIIKRSLYYSNISEGNFDITVAPLSDIWNEAREKKSIPLREEIDKALRHVGYKNIILDEKRSTIHFLDKGTKIDLGGIVKGYAVDRAKDILFSLGIRNALINIGGNIYALGNRPDGEAWQIGIRHPRKKDEIIYRLSLKNRGISTSGDYERFFVLGDKRFSHIVNPRTGDCSQGIMGVTIIADSAEKADVLSTAVFVMGVEKGIEFIKSLEKTEVYIIDIEERLVKDSTE